MNTTTQPAPSLNASADATALAKSLALLARFRAEAQSRGAHGRDFILSCLALGLERVGAFLLSCAASARGLSERIEEERQVFEEIVADGQVTPDERRRYEKIHARAQREALALAQTLRTSCES
jgi:hypothetical protein